MKIQFETQNQVIGYAHKASTMQLPIRILGQRTLEILLPDNEVPQEFKTLAQQYPVSN